MHTIPSSDSIERPTEPRRIFAFRFWDNTISWCTDATVAQGNDGEDRLHLHDRREIESTKPPHPYVIPLCGVSKAWEIHEGELHEITADFLRKYLGPYRDELSVAPSFRSGTEVEPFRTLREEEVI